MATPIILNVCSPKSGFVTAIHVTNNKTVAQGDVLLDLDTEEEDKNLERLAHLSSTHRIAAKKYAGPQFDRACAIAESIIALSQDTVNKTTILLDAQKTRRVIGMVVTEEIAGAEIALDKARTDLSQLQGDLEKTRATAANYGETAALTQKHIDFERAQLEKRKALMTVRAPISGVLSLQVATGSFIKMGHVMLTIEG